MGSYETFKNFGIVFYFFLTWLMWLDYVAIIIARAFGCLSSSGHSYVWRWGMILSSMPATLIMKYSYRKQINTIGKIASQILLSVAYCLIIFDEFPYRNILLFLVTLGGIFFTTLLLQYQLRPLMRMSIFLIWVFYEITIMDLAAMLNVSLDNNAVKTTTIFFGALASVTVMFDPAELLVQTSFFKKAMTKTFNTLDPYIKPRRPIYIPSAEQRPAELKRNADTESKRNTDTRFLNVCGAICTLIFFSLFILYFVKTKVTIAALTHPISVGCLPAAIAGALGFLVLELRSFRLYVFIIIIFSVFMTLLSITSAALFMFEIAHPLPWLLASVAWVSVMIVRGMMTLSNETKNDDWRQRGFCFIFFATLIVISGKPIAVE
ncbi:hypothetical protein [Cacatuid alphaherpesvirus 2]|uniref:Envelope protein UL43 n=1 Tax=Cacatuid alphaherpesvirus 2 TaxID=2604840 RepID=A0A5B9R2H4_9ALPH|nr:hypothetical protein QKT46_gp41 [Cacatuid alphaherpesvirus 2]QEG54076.1 hypothetical protein [Cacatuid alphaherpesvirus 2]